MRLIDAGALKKAIPDTRVDIFENCRNCTLLSTDEVLDIVNEAPTIDAVPVVRCKDCEKYDAEEDWCPHIGRSIDVFEAETFFCADGEREVE